MTPSWKSSDTTVARVDAAGVVIGVRAGTATISASSGRSRGSFALTVHPVVKFGVFVAPKLDSLYVGQTRQLSAVVVDSLGARRTDRVVGWALSDSGLATVGADGLVRATERGTVTVYASSGGLGGAADIKVLRHVGSIDFPSDTVDVALGTTRLLEPVLSDSGGHPTLGRRVEWSVSSEGSVVSVDATGAVTAVGAGVARVTATSEGVSGSTFVRVVPHVVWSVVVDAPERWVTVGRTLQLATRLYDSNTFTLDHRVVSWSSSDTSVATVSNDGVVTGRARGRVTITAESEGVTGASALDVELPVAALSFPIDSLVIPASTPVFLAALARDSAGNVLGSRTGTWESSDPTVLSFDVPGSPSTADPFQAGRVTVKATIDGRSATLPVIVTPAQSDYVYMYVTGYTTALSQFSLDVYVQNPTTGMLPGRTVVVHSSDTTVASLAVDSAVTDGSGVTHFTVTAKRPGQVMLVASSGSAGSTRGVAVAPNVPAKVTIANEPTSPLAVGATYQLAATTVDWMGQSYPYALHWSSSDASVATVSSSGVVTGTGGGVARIVAVAAEAAAGVAAPADTAMLVVSVPAAPVLTGISPVELVPGASGVITGDHFDADAAANVVTVDGVRATVTAASATQLSITLPPAASFACRSTRSVPVVVSTGAGLVGATMRPLATAPQRTLAVGESTFIPADARCLELVGSTGFYLLATSNPGRTAESSVSAVVRGDTGTSTSAAALASRAGTRSSTWGWRGGSRSDVLPVDLAAVRRRAAAHRRILEANRATARRYGAPGPHFARVRAAALAGNDSLAATLAVTSPTLGALSFMRVWAPDADACSGYRTVQVRTVYVGQEVTIAEDVSAPLARQMDDEYRKLGAEVEASMLPLVRANFGNPLAADTQLGLGGRVVLLFTPTVNAMGNVQAYVSGCDFYPAAVAPASNQAPVLYAVVPTSGSIGFSSGTFTRDVWRHVIRATVVHETKHLASLSERLARGASVFEESWLEEASAMAAMEIWGRAFTGAQWKGHVSYAQDLYCEVRPTTPSCAGHPYVMFDHFAYLYDYLSAVETHSPLGGVDYTDATFYGSGWALLRWAADQYAGSEAGFFRALTQETSLSGVANLEARTGHPFSEMSADWGLATVLGVHYANARPTRAQLTEPSWNLNDVFAGMWQDFPQYFGGTMPQPMGALYCWVPSLSAPVVRGGSSSYAELSTCSGSKRFVDVKTGGGAPVSVEVVRIQ